MAKQKQAVQEETPQAEVAATPTPEKKPTPEVVAVQMTDGRVVQFTGKRQLQKEIIQDGLKIGVRFDFRNGQTLTCWVPEQHMTYAAGHGYAQKLGDEIAGLKDKDGSPASEEDKVLAIETLHKRLSESAEWNAVGSGESGVSGASIVLKALMEASGKSLEEVKAFIEKKLTAAKEKGEVLTRAALYQSFRNPESKVGQIIARLEREKASKGAKLNSDELYQEMMAG